MPVPVLESVFMLLTNFAGRLALCHPLRLVVEELVGPPPARFVPCRLCEVPEAAHDGSAGLEILVMLPEVRQPAHEKRWAARIYAAGPRRGF